MLRIEDDAAIRLTRGDSAVFKINIFNSDGSVYEIKQNDEVLFTVKRNTRTDEYIIQKKSDLNGEVFFTPEDTALLSYGTYKYDIQVRNSLGVVNTIVGPANFVLTDEVTF